jgi:hypothetical protein
MMSDDAESHDAWIRRVLEEAPDDYYYWPAQGEPPMIRSLARASGLRPDEHDRARIEEATIARVVAGVKANLAIADRQAPKKPKTGDFLGGVEYYYEMNLGGHHIILKEVAKIVDCHLVTLQKQKALFDVDHPDYKDRLKEYKSARR